MAIHICNDISILTPMRNIFGVLIWSVVITQPVKKNA